MKIQSEILLQELEILTKGNIQFAEKLLEMPFETLNFRSSDKSWSALECLQHLNFYSDFYIPEIGKRISESKHSASKEYKVGILGNYFANSMLPKEKLNKMKTLKSMNPIHSNLTLDVVKTFIHRQNQMLQLLEKAKNVDLGKTKTSISISKLIQLKLGDTFRFVIYHNLRHIKQAENAIKKPH